MMKYLDLSLTICFVSFYLLLATINGESDNMDPPTTCLNNINLLEEDSNLMEATTTLLDSYNETCTQNGSCSSEVKSSMATTKNDFTFLVTGNSLQRMERACNNILPGSTLCLVTNEVIKGELRTIEINKPVCFPPSCDENDSNEIRFLDPNPGNCDPSSIRDPCTISSTQVACPKFRTENLDAATCQSEASTILSNNALNRFVSSLRNSVVRGCLSVLLGGTSPVCEITTPLLVIASQNYSGVENIIKTEYENFEQSCLNLESDTAICKISVHINVNEAQSFLEMETDLTYTDLPLCLPLDCTHVDPLITAHEQLVKDNFDCDPLNSICEVSVTKFECAKNNLIPDSTQWPTQAPSTMELLLPSNSPTSTNDDTDSASPSITMTTKPSENASSSFPSKIDTSAFPTINTSTSPSTDTSSSPSIDTSTSPSIDTSTSPSTDTSSSPSMDTSASPSTATSAFPTIYTSTSPSTATSAFPTINTSTSPSTDTSTSPTSITSPSESPSNTVSTSPLTSASMNPSINPSHADNAFPSTTEQTFPDTNRFSKFSNHSQIIPNDLASSGESVELGRINSLHFSFLVLLLSSWFIL